MVAYIMFKMSERRSYHEIRSNLHEDFFPRERFERMIDIILARFSVSSNKYDGRAEIVLDAASINERFELTRLSGGSEGSAYFLDKKVWDEDGASYKTIGRYYSGSDTEGQVVHLNSSYEIIEPEEATSDANHDALQLLTDYDPELSEQCLIDITNKHFKPIEGAFILSDREIEARLDALRYEPAGV